MPQGLHPDFETNAAETEYFFLGTGRVMAALQWSKNSALTPVGLLLSTPESFARKWSTALFHPEHGLNKTEITVTLAGKRYRPTHESTTVGWEWMYGVPTVHVRWQAGSAEIHERYTCNALENCITRDVEILNAPDQVAQIEIALYANPAHYNWFDTKENCLRATNLGREDPGGSARSVLRPLSEISLRCTAPNSVKERTMTIEASHASIEYRLGGQETSAGIDEYEYWKSATTLTSKTTTHRRLAELYHIAAMGLRAAVSTSGRFDASIWQYGFEWSGDAANVAEALIHSGQFSLAQSVLSNILTRLSNDEGMVMESSRFRGGEDSELNNNGAVLKACQTYLDWTGDLDFLRTHFKRISAIADYPLRSEYFDEATGLVRASRDIWERNAALGIRTGYDISHQTYSILGWNAAAAIASALGEDGNRWSDAAAKMQNTFLHHPTHAMIEDGKIIKRRLIDGSVQLGLRVDESQASAEFLKEFRPEGSPLHAASLVKDAEASWEPDASEVFPICFGIVDGRSPIAKKTMREIETLWSQAWEGGGYGRYNIASEPDSPGPWPFATGFIAAAYLEMGETAQAMKSIEWLIEKAGSGGSWFEFYGDRPTPPLPPTGIIVWAWAQWITLLVRHVLNAKVMDHQLRIEPRIEGIGARIRFRDSYVSSE